jgi:hypothetical protein
MRITSQALNCRKSLSEFEFILKFARELSKESLGREELRIAIARIGGRGSGSKGGDNNEERLRKMVADHLRASELSAINTRTPEGLASLTAILGQALQAGLTAGEA